MNKPSEFGIKGRLKEFSGDPAYPEAGGNRYIVIPVSDKKENTPTNKTFKRWATADVGYKSWFNQSFNNMQRFVGQIKCVQVQSDTVVANALCRVGDDIDYTAVEKCFAALGVEVKNNSGNVHIAKFGDWDKVEPIIKEQLLNRGINVNVYCEKES